VGNNLLNCSAMTLVGTQLNAVYTSIGTHIQTALGGGG
jgi:hypothetical protein